MKTDTQNTSVSPAAPKRRKVRSDQVWYFTVHDARSGAACAYDFEAKLFYVPTDEREATRFQRMPTKNHTIERTQAARERIRRLIHNSAVKRKRLLDSLCSDMSILKHTCLNHEIRAHTVGEEAE